MINRESVKNFTVGLITDTVENYTILSYYYFEYTYVPLKNVTLTKKFYNLFCNCESHE